MDYNMRFGFKIINIFNNDVNNVNEKNDALFYLRKIFRFLRFYHFRSNKWIYSQHRAQQTIFDNYSLKNQYINSKQIFINLNCNITSQHIYQPNTLHYKLFVNPASLINRAQIHGPDWFQVQFFCINAQLELVSPGLPVGPVQQLHGLN